MGGLKKTPKQQRLNFVIFSMFIISIALSITLYAFDQYIEYFKTPTDLIEYKVVDKKIRLGGLVKEGSLVEDGETIKFLVTDNKNDKQVIYKGFIPSLFREGQGVIAIGKMNKEGVFIAEQILAKHDENYMPPEVYEALKKNGYKRKGEE